MVQADQDSAKVTFPPPIMLLLSILIGIGLQYFFVIRLWDNPTIRFIGYAMIALGFFTVVYCGFMFKKAHTNIQPWKATNAIVHRGPYRISRNPIYLSFIIFGLGIAIATNNGWIFISQLILAIIIDRNVIAKEEKYLEQKFNDTYRTYKSTTRRWL